MPNWYRQSQATEGTPGTEGAPVVPGAPQPNPVMDQPDAMSQPEGAVDYTILDKRIKDDVIAPLFGYYQTFISEAYPQYEGENNAFMSAMISLYERGIIIGFRRHLESYNNISQIVADGDAGSALDQWIDILLEMFPEGEAKIMLQNELSKIEMELGMQGVGA